MPQTETSAVDGAVDLASQAASTAWKPPTTRKTPEERFFSIPGTVVPPHLESTMDKSSAIYEEVLRRGPKATPMLDRLGYKINYKKLERSNRLPSRRQIARRMAFFEEERREHERLEEIMGRSVGSAMQLMAFPDRVARDLDIPYHTVGMPEYEEWHRRGFCLQPGELEGPFPAEERKRIDALASGSGFRV